VLADVCPAAGDDQLLHHGCAGRTWLTLSTVDEEAVLEGPGGAVDMAKVVDRRSLGLDAGTERVLDRVA
jgi:hypothetical protein